MIIGTLFPLLILYNKKLSESAVGILYASVLVLFGGFTMLYVIIISGQAFPLDLFPGYSESSTFYDGVEAAYIPSVYELMLGLGGVGISAAIYLFAIMVLDLPQKVLIMMQLPWEEFLIQNQKLKKIKKNLRMRNPKKS